MTRVVTDWSGSPAAVIGSVLIVLIWALTGPIFGFSDTWQLVINTGTTILIFNMVFVIQAAQNRDGAAVQIKLDETLKAIASADDAKIGIEDDGRAMIAAAKKQLLKVKKGS